MNKYERNGSYIEDSITGELTYIASKNDKYFEKSRGSYLLIDTLDFFEKNTIISSEDFKIRVKKKSIIKKRIREKNTYVLSGIGIKQNLYWVAIFHPYSNRIVVYGFSIDGKKMKIEKIQSGVF